MRRRERARAGEDEDDVEEASLEATTITIILEEAAK